jgi:hypothetical protein
MSELLILSRSRAEAVAPLRSRRRAEHQRARRSSQFDRRREGAGGLIFRDANKVNVT